MQPSNNESHIAQVVCVSYVKCSITRTTMHTTMLFVLANNTHEYCLKCYLQFITLVFMFLMTNLHERPKCTRSSCVTCPNTPPVAQHV